MKVLDSDLSHQMSAWIHLPDAILGCLAYLGDIIFGMAGSTRRWQFRPWLVILFGIDVIPLGIVSAVLVFLQGTVVGHYCFLCMVAAVISLILVFMAYDEVHASVLYLYKVWKKTKSLKTLWNAFCGRPSEAAYEAGMEITGEKYVG